MLSARAAFERIAELSQEPSMESVLRTIREICERNAPAKKEDSAEAGRQESRQKPEPSARA
jgi:hypothetical protein